MSEASDAKFTETHMILQVASSAWAGGAQDGHPVEFDEELHVPLADLATALAPFLPLPPKEPEA